MTAERESRMRWHRRRTRRPATAPQDASDKSGSGKGASGTERGVPGLAWLVVGLLALLAAAFIGGGAAAAP